MFTSVILGYMKAARKVARWSRSHFQITPQNIFKKKQIHSEMHRSNTIDIRVCMETLMMQNRRRYITYHSVQNVQTQTLHFVKRVTETPSGEMNVMHWMPHSFDLETSNHPVTDSGDMRQNMTHSFTCY